jgi:hypothetical protein
MSRPMWLEEIISYYSANGLPVEWPPRPPQVKCAVKKVFDYGGTRYVPSKDPRIPEFILFELSEARALEGAGQIALWSPRLDIGTAKLAKLGIECPVYRPWVEVGEVAPRDDPLIPVKLMKRVQIFPMLPADELVVGSVFATSYTAIKKLGHYVEGVPINEGGPLMILQP